jgi:hypothetical protein
MRALNLNSWAALRRGRPPFEATLLGRRTVDAPHSPAPKSMGRKSQHCDRSDRRAAARAETQPAKTTSGPAAGHRGHAQPPAPAASAPRSPPSRTPPIGRRSTLGPRWVNRGSRGQPWVPAQKSSTVGPRDQCSLLRALGNQTKLSTFDTVAFRVRRRADRFHALHRAPPLHSPCQKFGNTDYFLKIPAKAKIRCSMKMGGSPVISCEGRKMLQRTRVRQVFRRGII